MGVRVLHNNISESLFVHPINRSLHTVPVKGRFKGDGPIFSIHQDIYLGSGTQCQTIINGGGGWGYCLQYP